MAENVTKALGGLYINTTSKLWVYEHPNGRLTVEAGDREEVVFVHLPKFTDGREKPIEDALRQLAKACNEYARAYPPQPNAEGVLCGDPTAKELVG